MRRLAKLLRLGTIAMVAGCVDGHSPTSLRDSDIERRFSSATSGAAATVFGPVRFERIDGRPSDAAYVIDARGFDGPFTLSVTNGAPDGTRRVTAAWIEIDGQLILGPTDFGSGSGSLSADVALAASSTLNVRLASEVGAFLHVRIDGHVTTSATVGSDGGAVAFHGGDVVIDVPAGALDGETVLTVTPAADPPPAGTTPLGGTHFEFGPDGATFDQPVAITISYDPAQVPSNVNVDDLRLFVRDESTGEWQALDGSVNAAAHTVTGLFHHFSQGGILTLAHVCASGAGYPDFASAIGALLPGGTIRVCTDAPTTQRVVVDRPLVMEPEPGAAPTIHTPAAEGFLVEAVPTGSVIFRGVAFTSAGGPSVLARGAYDRVELDDVAVAPTNAGIGVLASTVPGAAVLVNASSFTGGRWGIRTVGGGTVHVTGSSFTDQITAAIELNGAVGEVRNNTIGPTCGDRGCVRIIGAGAEGLVIGNQIAESRTDVDPFFHHVVLVSAGAFGRIEDNDFDGCGHGSCVLAINDATAEIVNNRFTVYAAHETRHVIIGSDGSGGVDMLPPPTLLATDNVITGVGGTPGAFENYAVRSAALAVEWGASITAHRNTISNAQRGLMTFSGGIITDARDNVIDNVFWGMTLFEASRGTANFNDITNAVEAIAVDNSDLTLSDFTCNWWGSTAGPQNLPAHIHSSLYARWAAGPAAGGAGGACTGGPAVVTVDPATDGSHPFTFATAAGAVTAVGAAGTVQFADGEHVVDGVGIHMPMTLTAAPGGAPRIQGIDPARNHSLVVVGVPTGQVTFRDLSFTASTRAPLRTSGQFDQVLIENCTFSGYGVTGVEIGTGTAGARHVTIRNSSFTGGSHGVFAWSGATIDVQGSTFSTHSFSGIQVQGGTGGSLVGNTVSNCGPSGCIRLAGVGDFDVRNNQVSNTYPRPVQWGILAAPAPGATIDIIGNTVAGAGDGGADYAFSLAGIRIAPLVLADPGIVNAQDNIISNAGDGISIAGSGGSISGNEISVCGRACIWIGSSTRDVAVSGNTLHATGARPTFFGILAHWLPTDAGNLRIAGNQVLGVGLPADRAGSNSYPWWGSGIQAGGGKPVTVENNRVEGADKGIAVFENGRIMGRDNVVTGTKIALMPWHGVMTMTSSDLTDFVFATDSETVDVARLQDLTCNWWGSAGGPPPGTVFAHTPASVYTPWATTPVAGSSVTSCAGGS